MVTADSLLCINRADFFSAVISGNTLSSICSQVNDRVQEEQAKTIWVDI